MPAASAWNDFGHMVVADIAYRRLQPKTRARISTLLKLNPSYELWSKELSATTAPARREEDIFMLAATWPDAIRLDPSYIPDGAQDQAKANASIAMRNIGYCDHLMHKSWHFYNAQLSQDGSPASTSPVPIPNAKTQIDLFRRVLSTSATASTAANDQLKSFDLVWLIHLVADIHQPLHCTTRVSKFRTDGDDGGNDVFLDTKTKYQCRLHTYWDNSIGTGQIEDAFNLAGGLKTQTKYRSNNTDISSWVQESYASAKNNVYVEPVRWGKGPFQLSRTYEKSAREEAIARIEVAGERLARLLNAELK